MVRQANGEGVDAQGNKVPIRGQDAWVAPPSKAVAMEDPHFHVADNKGYGVLFTIVLLLVILITNVPLRGLWSVVVIVAVFLLSIIFALADWWGPILDAVGKLHIYINAAGYFLIALALFGVWLLTLLLFDPQIYMVFTPGQLRVHQEIGG